MAELNAEQKLLLDIIAAALFRKPVNIPSYVDWMKLIRECRSQSVVMLAYSVCEPFIPKNIKQAWNMQYYSQVANTVRVEWEHGELHGLMSEHSIPYVVIKGCASAVYYPDPSMRAMGDVDFLVSDQDLEKAGAVLKNAGFVSQEDEKDDIHIAYCRKQRNVRSIWEMHWEPNGIPKGEVGRNIRSFLKTIVTDAQCYQTPTGVYMGPTLFHHGLIILLHIATHMINQGIGLRHLCDWAVFVGKLSEKEFLEIFEDKLKEVGLWKFAQILTQLSIRYLGCPYKKWASKPNEKLLEDIIEDIFVSGNFGCKDNQRINQAKLMTNKTRGTVDDTPFIIQLAHTMNEKAKLGFEVCIKYPVFLPIGWLYVGSRHLFRIMRGKRPQIQFGQMISGASVRREIYKHFDLFVKK